MKEGTSKHLALLAVELYEITERFIYELREKQHVSQDVFNYLPEYTINHNKTAKKQPIPARYYHQFVGTLEPKDSGEKYLYFNLRTLDAILAEEISNSGIEDLFAEMNFEKLLSKFSVQTEEEITKFVFPRTHYLVVELTYITSYDHFSGAYEGDLEVDIIGYLDDNLMRQSFNAPIQKFKEGDEVSLPFDEEGEVAEYLNKLWGTQYNVKITKSNGFNEVGAIADFFEKDLELIKK